MIGKEAERIDSEYGGGIRIKRVSRLREPVIGLPFIYNPIELEVMLCHIHVNQPL